MILMIHSRPLVLFGLAQYFHYFGCSIGIISFFGTSEFSGNLIPNLRFSSLGGIFLNDWWFFGVIDLVLVLFYFRRFIMHWWLFNIRLYFEYFRETIPSFPLLSSAGLVTLSCISSPVLSLIFSNCSCEFLRELDFSNCTLRFPLSPLSAVRKLPPLAKLFCVMNSFGGSCKELCATK